MSLHENWKLREAPINRPQLVHSASKQSITASEDYHSLPEDESGEDVSDEGQSVEQAEQVPVLRYFTPPSRVETPLPGRDHERLRSEAYIVPLQPRRQQQQQQQPLLRRAHSPGRVWYDERRSVRRQQPGGVEEDSRRPRNMNNDDEDPARSITPGVDNNPYIRFAVEQLTVDEDARGKSRIYAVEPPELGDRPLHRNGGSGYPVQHVQPGYIQRKPLPNPFGLVPRLVGEQQPTHGRLKSPDQSDIFLPIDPPDDSLQYPALNFLPTTLQPAMLALFVFLCIMFLAGLLVSAIWSRRNQGLVDYDTLGSSRYFVFQYLPTMLGMVILLWVFQIQKAVHRVAPFMAMASYSAKSRTEAVLLPLVPVQHLFPDLSFLRAGEMVIGCCVVTFWLFIWTVPLLSCLFNVSYVGTPEDGSWRWTTVQGVVWTLVTLYTLLIAATTVLGMWLLIRRTGLKWDPRSLADIVVLLEQANIMDDYSGSEVFEEASEFRTRLSQRSDRLGYWRTSRRPNDIFYGIGEEGAATRRYAIRRGKIREKSDQYEDPPMHSRRGRRRSSPNGTLEQQIQSSAVRYGYVPWFLGESAVVAWIVIAIVLLLAFLIVSFVNSAVLTGFDPRVTVPTNNAGFSGSNFLYSFVPCFLGFLLFLFWTSIDTSFRVLQPFASLASPAGATAETSLLLDYTALAPFWVSIQALGARHFKVAWLSFITLVSATFPILGGGVFWTQFHFSDLTVRVSAHPRAYYTLCVFLALYAFSFLAVFPRQKRYLPHPVTNLAQIISFVYQSPLLSDPAFQAPSSRTDLVTRLLTSETGLTPRYAFGLYQGRDGKEHLGLDRLQRAGSTDMLLFTHPGKANGRESRHSRTSGRWLLKSSRDEKGPLSTTP